MLRDYKVIGSLLLSMIFWAFSFVWIKQAFEAFEPLTIVLMRLCISVVMLFAILLIKKQSLKIQPADVKWFVLLAFFEPFLYFMGESFGLKSVSSTVGAVIISTIPLFGPLVDRLFFNTRVKLVNTIGIFVSFFGVMLLIFEPNLNLSAPLAGLALIFLAVFAAVGYSIVLRKIPDHYHPIQIIAYQNLIGIVFFLPLFLQFELHHFLSTDITSSALLAVVQLAVFASSFAFILYTYGLRKIGITKSNAFINFIPVFTAIFAWWILKEKLSAQNILGIAIVIAGVFVSQIKRKKHVV